MSEANVSSFPDLGSDLTGKIIGAAIDVHKELGPGLLENVYETCLCYELVERGMGAQRQLALPVHYKGREIEEGFRIDLLVDDEVLIELKSCENVLPIQRSQIITYMRFSKTSIGLLINFNKKVLKDGIQRFALAEHQ